jgi:hypothetical protein
LLVLIDDNDFAVVVAAPGQLIVRINFGVADDDDDVELVVLMDADAAPDLELLFLTFVPTMTDLEPLFLTFVRTMNRQISGLPRIRR